MNPTTKTASPPVVDATEFWGAAESDLVLREENPIVEAASGMSAGPLAAVGAPDGGTLAALIEAARHIDRTPRRLIERAKQVGGLLADEAFYRFPAGDKTIEGPSIDLAQALAQEWGGLLFTVNVTRAEPLPGGSQRITLRARATDLRTLVLAEVDQLGTTSAPPGRFALKEEQKQRWLAMQVMNMASKTLRNAILRVLPEWYVGPALAAAFAEDARRSMSGAKTLPEARAAALATLATAGVTEDEAIEHVGQPVDLWATPQLSELRTLFKALRDGALSIERFRADLAAVRAAATVAAGTAPATRTALGLTPTPPAAATAPAAAAAPGAPPPPATPHAPARTRRPKAETPAAAAPAPAGQQPPAPTQPAPAAAPEREPGSDDGEGDDGTAPPAPSADDVERILREQEAFERAQQPK